jgi:hypothetical protein
VKSIAATAPSTKMHPQETAYVRDHLSLKGTAKLKLSSADRANLQPAYISVRRWCEARRSPIDLAEHDDE